MDTAVLTLRGRGDRTEGGDRRVQAEACHMHPLPGTSHGGQSKTSAKKTTSSALCKGSSGGRAKSEGECWQESSLVKEEVPGRYGCRPKSICTSLRFEEMKPGRQENLFFINHTWFTTTALQASYKRSPVKHPASYTLAAECINSCRLTAFRSLRIGVQQ